MKKRLIAILAMLFVVAAFLGASKNSTTVSAATMKEASADALLKTASSELTEAEVLAARAAGEPYVGNINSELQAFSINYTATGAAYLYGQIVVVEWICNDTTSTVPLVPPKMTFKSTDGTESIEVFVTPTGTNTYYFDRFIEGLSPDKEYVFEIASGSENNVADRKSMNVLLSTSPTVPSAKTLGIVGFVENAEKQRICYKESDNGELRLYSDSTYDGTFEGNINSVLLSTSCQTSNLGNFVSGQIVVVEWICDDTVSTVPATKPKMTFMSVDETETLDVFVTPTGTNTYYFDRLLGDMDTNKEYKFKIELTDEGNIAARKSMTVMTTEMAKKEGVLWTTDTQVVLYKTDAASGELRIYAVNKADYVVPTKKGIQGTEYLTDENPDELGVSHVLFNIDVMSLINKDAVPGYDYPYTYQGTNYYVKWPDWSQYQVKTFNDKGITVTAVLLMSWDDDLSYLIHPNARQEGHPYYAWNTVDADARKQLEAIFSFLLENYSSDTCHIDNWIIGNEVNMPNHYHYTGTTNAYTNADMYADEYLLFYNVMKSKSSTAKAYISLDHSWSHNDEGRGIAGKEFLNQFNSRINAKQSNVAWNIAYHLYTPIMTSSAMWEPQYSYYTPNNVNADFISGVNLKVLTDYVKNHFGSNVRIILSEQGYTTNGNFDQQAAALAYSYYAAEFNDMIDAFIYRTYYDTYHEAAQNFHFGLIDGYDSSAVSNKRPIYYVFKYMDTAQSSSYCDRYLSTIGVSSWSQIIPNYDSSVFTTR